MQRKPRILIAPLDWGLGHATRCIPIIQLLLQNNVKVIIAADGRPLALLQTEFPNLEFIQLKGYSISYSEKSSMFLKMLFSIPKIMIGIYREHNELKEIIKNKKIDIVISDNRFGLWNKKIKSVIITHQLMIKTPFGERLLHKLNLFFLNKYNECWIPDEQGATNLSGDLSHKYTLTKNTFFIGVLSRFDIHRNKMQTDKKYKIIAIISGPEPQRTLFEQLVGEQILQNDFKSLIICGKTEVNEKSISKGNLHIVNHLNSYELQEAILESEIVIARSGYSTIMDLATLGKNAIFVPTPGQTEQEYLSELLMKKGIAFSQKQSEFNLKEALIQSKNYNGFEIFASNDELKKRIQLLLSTML